MKPDTRAVVRVICFAAVAAVTSFLIGSLGGDGSLREWLLSAAGALEFWGVLLVASPELAPVLRRIATALVALRGATAALAHRATGQGLAELRDERLTERLGGVVLLVLGLALATWGNLA